MFLEWENNSGKLKTINGKLQIISGNFKITLLTTSNEFQWAIWLHYNYFSDFIVPIATTFLLKVELIACLWDFVDMSVLETYSYCDNRTAFSF